MNALMHSTQVAVTLSLNIVTKTGNDARLTTLPIIQLTMLIFSLWSIWQIVGRFRFEVSMITREVIATAKVTSKVLTIGFTSIAYGLGVMS